ncbi:unnamed protein product [Notodromas monacha]|uniref:Uncharacterized protein n=1 Tax=Notodromas monacha TaxID=399045 RepID=A0A7R9GB27_9CRUS|nr:unnamed protein product [Notodromas monacha]CAG0914600.1 unnamed protein product [Notodromas monacha]
MMKSNSHPLAREQLDSDGVIERTVPETRSSFLTHFVYTLDYIIVSVIRNLQFVKLLFPETSSKSYLFLISRGRIGERDIHHASRSGEQHNRGRRGRWLSTCIEGFVYMLWDFMRDYLLPLWIPVLLLLEGEKMQEMWSSVRVNSS